MLIIYCLSGYLGKILPRVQQSKGSQKDDMNNNVDSGLSIVELATMLSIVISLMDFIHSSSVVVINVQTHHPSLHPS